MLKKYLEFSFAFLIIFIVQLLVESDPKTTHLVLGDFKYVVKPLIAISLMVFYLYQTQLKGRFAKRIFIGLFFGLVGDCLLMFVDVNESFFIYGLIAFLVGHLSYISAFYLDYKWNPSIEKSATRIALFIFGTICLVFYLVVRPHLGGMKIPVLVYAFTISLMAIMAVNRKGRVSSLSYSLILFGAVIFIISDCSIAINKFVYPFEGAGLVIMSTYMIAQFLITVGAVERKLKKSTAIDPRKR